MKSVATIAILFAVAAMTAVPAAAHEIKSKKADRQELRETIRQQRKALAHYRGVVTFWNNHRGSFDRETRPSYPWCGATSTHIPARVCWHARASAWTAKKLQANIWESQVDIQIRVAMRDWISAIAYVQRAFPATDVWLVRCSSTEGSHGGWVPNHRGSGAGGWMQFMSGTFYSNVDAAFAVARSRGLRIPDEARSWYSPLGQAVTAAWMRSTGADRGQWTGSGC